MPLSPEKIRSRREALKLTQVACAQLSGMPQQHWSRIESGKNRDPVLSTLERVAVALRCRLEMLLD